MMRRFARPLLLAALAALPADARAQRRRVLPAAGVHMGGPVRLSLAAGILVPVARWRDVDQGLLVLLEPGWRGDRVSAGWGTMVGQFGGILSLRASALRMRRDPGPTTYVGGELQLAPLLLTGMRLSAFVPTRRDRGQRTTLLADLSIGF